MKTYPTGEKRGGPEHMAKVVAPRRPLTISHVLHMNENTYKHKSLYQMFHKLKEPYRRNPSQTRYHVQRGLVSSVLYLAVCVYFLSQYLHNVSHGAPNKSFFSMPYFLLKKRLVLQ